VQTMQLGLNRQTYKIMKIYAILYKLLYVRVTFQETDLNIFPFDESQNKISCRFLQKENGTCYELDGIFLVTATRRIIASYSLLLLQFNKFHSGFNHHLFNLLMIKNIFILSHIGLIRMLLHVCFLKNAIFSNGNRTEWSPIRSVIIRVIEL
jgi:hypothetical protein